MHQAVSAVRLRLRSNQRNPFTAPKSTISNISQSEDYGIAIFSE